jgi:hypothetical protein
MARKFIFAKSDTGLPPEGDQIVKVVGQHVFDKLVALYPRLIEARDASDNSTGRFAVGVAVSWAGKRPAFKVRARVNQTHVLDSEGVVDDPKQGKLNLNTEED